jgi:hypothetical protein
VGFDHEEGDRFLMQNEENFSSKKQFQEVI